MLRICIHCQSPFRPHQKVPNQKFCSSAECQTARRMKWQKQKIKKDDDYKKNQARAQKAWAKNNPEYWRNYRESHPEYVRRNRMLQKKRNIKSRLGFNCPEISSQVIAKMDELHPKYHLISGYYMLYPIKSGKIAKMDEMLVKIEIISMS